MFDPVEDVVQDMILEHHGVKGMKWGVRRAKVKAAAASRAAARKKPVPVSVETKTGDGKPSKIISKGGENQPVHKDALVVAPAKQKLKKSGVSTLSNEELQKLADRMNLEQRVQQLASKDAQASMSSGQKFISNLMTDTKTQQTTLEGIKLASNFAGPVVKKVVKNKVNKKQRSNQNKRPLLLTP